MMHICISKVNFDWFIQWLVPCLTLTYHLNKCWLIVNWTLSNKFKWHLNQNRKIFIQENASENAVCKMSPILSQPQCVTPGMVWNRCETIIWIYVHPMNQGSFCVSTQPMRDHVTYNVTSSVIGWVHAQNDLWWIMHMVPCLLCFLVVRYS